MTLFPVFNLSCGRRDDCCLKIDLLFRGTVYACAYPQIGLSFTSELMSYQIGNVLAKDAVVYNADSCNTCAGLLFFFFKVENWILTISPITTCLYPAVDSNIVASFTHSVFILFTHNWGSMLV